LIAGGAAMLGVTLLVPLTHALAGGPGSRPPVPCPTFAAGNFSKPTTINNRYFPLVPGTRFKYTGSTRKTPVLDVVTVTQNTPTKANVKTTEVRDQVY
jgi:hypothetical protein